MKEFIKGFWKKPITVWEMVGYVFFGIIIIGTYWYFGSDTEQISTPMKSQEKIYETIHPEISESFSKQKLIGRVYSNEYAMIHPRREGIIKDILVDVGDTVTQGQSLAVLFPSGVEGQSSSQIAKVRAELLSAQENLANARNVAQETVDLAEKNFDEMQTKYRTTVEGGDFGQRSFLNQQYDNAQTVASQVMQNLRRVLFGDSFDTRTISSIQGSFSDSLLQTKVFDAYRELKLRESEFTSLNVEKKRRDILSYLTAISNVWNMLEQLYQTAIASRQHSESEIASHIQEIQTNQTKILQAQERLDNALLTRDQLEVSLETADKNIELAQSQTSQSVDLARNRLEIAQAAYEAEMAKSGHITITAPFSGTISSRLGEVGHMVKSSDPLFEMVGVQTTLGNESPLEVRFGLPEEMRNSVDIDDEIQVSVLGNDFQKFTASVTRMGGSLDMQTRTFMVHAELPSEINLAHNTNVYVWIADMSDPVFSIPTISIKRRRNQHFVWALDDDGNPRFLQVEVLAEDGEKSDVRGNLSLDMNLIEVPSVTLFRTSESWESDVLSNSTES